MPTFNRAGKIAVAIDKCCRMRGMVIACMSLIVMVLSVYAQVGNHEFINYDDEAYVISNPHVASGLTVNNIIWAFTSVGEKTGNWHPVTWLSHMVDVQFYGLNPRGHHLTSVVIHTISSLLLLFFLHRCTGLLRQSSFVAVMFALHPLHVESVAWVAERKDVLGAFFWFLTLLLYAEYAAKRKPVLYVLCVLSFVLGLMSKPMLVTLPIVMLLIDFWPLDRYRHKGLKQHPRQLTGTASALIKEKIPFFACSLFSCIVTIYAQAEAIATLPFPSRVENALIAYAGYIIKTFWPHDLAVLYPLNYTFSFRQVVASLLFLFFMSAIAVRSGRRFPYLAVGWFWYFITLIPVIGLIQVGYQSMADRYTYIPLIGIFIMVAWGIPDLTKGLKNRDRALVLLAVVIVVTSAALTWRQLSYWKSSISIYEHTLQVTTDNYQIHNHLGLAQLKTGNLDKAIQEFRDAVRIKPRFTEAHLNLGGALVSKGNLDAAIPEFLEVLRRDPKNGQAHLFLGIAFGSEGKLDAAIKEFLEVLRRDPDNSQAHYFLGIAFARKGNNAAAIQEFTRVLRRDPNNAQAHYYLGAALADIGSLDAAIPELREALRIAPALSEANTKLELLLLKKE